jgi:hypothetical protein
MQTKYSVGDKVTYDLGNGIDHGVVTRIEINKVNNPETSCRFKIWAKWENGDREQWFGENDGAVEIIQSENTTQPAEPKYSKETVKTILIAYVGPVLGYNKEFVSDEIIEKTFQEVNKEPDPEYAEYLRLKSKFETN